MNIYSTKHYIPRAQNFPKVELGNAINITKLDGGIGDKIADGLTELFNTATEELQVAVLNKTCVISFKMGTQHAMIYKLHIGSHSSYGIVGPVNDLDVVKDPAYETTVMTYPAFKSFVKDPYLGIPRMHFKTGLQLEFIEGRYPTIYDKYKNKVHIVVENNVVVKTLYDIHNQAVIDPSKMQNYYENGLYRNEDGGLVKCDYTIEELTEGDNHV